MELELLSQLSKVISNRCGECSGELATDLFYGEIVRRSGEARLILVAYCPRFPAKITAHLIETLLVLMQLSVQFLALLIYIFLTQRKIFFRL